MNGSFCNLCALALWLALHIFATYTVLTSSIKSETAVRCCDPALSVLVVLVSRNVFHVVSALQSIDFIYKLYTFHCHTCIFFSIPTLEFQNESAK